LLIAQRRGDEAKAGMEHGRILVDVKKAPDLFSQS
jgi:hypothetical protein